MTLVMSPRASCVGLALATLPCKGLALAASGCSKDAPRAEPASTAAPGAGGVAPGPSGGPPTSPPSTSYAARLEAQPGCKPKAPCTASVVIEAKGEYHINHEYPYKFRPAEAAPGVQWAKQVFPREDGRFEEKRGTLPVTFTVDEAGAAKLAGVFSLSVCSAASCLMDRQTLEATVEVK